MTPIMTRRIRARRARRGRGYRAPAALVLPGDNPHHEKRWLILGVIGDRPAHGRARLDDREHRAAERAGGPRLLRRLAPVDHHRLRAGVRLAAAARRPARRPVRAQVGVHRRPDRVRRRLGRRRRRRLVRACSSPRARRRARSARCSRPSALALLSTIFTDPAERGKAFGIFGAIAGGGAAVGLLLGGILTEWLTWRWCLYVNLLFALPTAVAALRLLVNQALADRPPIDWLGTVAATTGPVRARLRLLELRDPLLGPPADDHLARRRRRAADRVRGRSRRAWRTRCSRCGWSPTARAAGRSWRSGSRASRCSRSSCS